MILLAEEQQAQQDADDLVKALEEANRKHEELVDKKQKMCRPLGRSMRQNNARRMQR